ncbi:MAG: endonuclease [Schlesneria sp.]|nr:endonuclease [Schlesneria sp.]
MPDKIPTYRPANRPSIEDNPQRAEDRAFYSSARWRRVRAAKLRITPLCECSQRCGRAAQECHHKIDRKQAPHLAYDISDLEALTKRCHSRVTRQRQLAAGATPQSSDAPQQVRHLP